MGYARNQNACVLSRHSGMTLAGTYATAFLDSGSRIGVRDRPAPE